MKLRNLFYLLLALPLVFAACTENTTDDKVPDTPNVKEPVLTLTSDAIMEFEAVGGEGEISYTLENEKEGAQLTAECTAEWVTDLTVGDKVTFTVAANDAEEARDTKITVKYDTKSFEVAVMQAAKQGEEPVPDQPVTVEAKALVGEYYGCDVEYNPNSDLYYIILSNKAIDFEAEEFVDGAAYYTLAVYAPKYEGEWTEMMTLPVGEYTFDMDETYAAGTIDGVESYYMLYDTANEEEIEPVMYEAAKLVVAETGVTLTATLNGVEHVVTFAGEQVIYNCTEPATPVVPQEPTEFAPVKVTASYYDTGNFILNLYGEGNVRHEFDMYDEVNPNDAFLSNGTYTSEDGTIGLGDSFFHNGNGQVGMESAELTLTLNETDWTMTIVGEFTSEEGQAHTIDWTGVVEGFAYPGMPQDYEATAVKATSTDGINWEITLFEYDSFYGDMFTRIVVALPEANYMHVPDGSYSLADGSIVANNGGTNNSFYRYNREADGGAMTECVLNVELDKDAETAKLSGYFVAGGDTINFEWNGLVEGFRYKEIGEEGITEWKNFYIYSQWSSSKCSNVKANSVDGTSINLYVTNNVDPVKHGLGEGTYVVDVWNSTEDRFVEGGENGGSKINGVQIELGGTMDVKKNGDVYTITINFTDLNGNVYKGVYVGDVPYTEYHDM